MSYAHDGTSFVTHWMVVHKPLMSSFLAALRPHPSHHSYITVTDAAFTRDSEQWSWIWNILEHLPDDDLFTGFSEYASYISWVQQNHPHRQHILGRKTWMRQPLGGKLGVWAAAASNWGWRCCPTKWQHWLMKAVGFVYYGMEAGHHGVCRFRQLAAKDGTYGL